MQSLPVSTQVQQLATRLNKALLERLMHSEQIEKIDEEITALRNVMAGVTLGQQLQQQIDAEKAQNAKVDPPALPTP